MIINLIIGTCFMEVDAVAILSLCQPGIEDASHGVWATCCTLHGANDVFLISCGCAKLQ